MTLTAKRAYTDSVNENDAWFEVLFQEHWQRVYGVVYRLVGDHAEAEDLTLETFWRLYDQQPTFGNEHQVNGWLYRVATNLGINALRARKRRRHYEEQAGSQILDEKRMVNPDAEFEGEEQRQRVQLALADMKPRSAKLLIMRHSGFSYAEIAATLGVAPGSVGTLLSRAEEEFEERYGRSGGG
ncbi:MAG: sigma-70 family RNA polymerase sigma factor [Anaerolineales bacterium]